jgi:hypothetical protein
MGKSYWPAPCNDGSKLQLIQPVLTDFRRSMATVHPGREWLVHIQHILDADLPQLNTVGHAPPVGKGQRAQQKLERYLARLQQQRDLPDQLVDFRQHLVDRSLDGVMICSGAMTSLACPQPTMPCAARLASDACDEINDVSRDDSLTQPRCWTKAPIWFGNVVRRGPTCWLASAVWPPITLIISRAIRSCGKSETIASWPIAYNISCLELCAN